MSGLGHRTKFRILEEGLLASLMIGRAGLKTVRLVGVATPDWVPFAAIFHNGAPPVWFALSN